MKQTTVGIEFEMNAWRRVGNKWEYGREFRTREAPRGWNTDYDGTVSAEIGTPKCRTVKELVNTITKGMRNFKQRNENSVPALISLEGCNVGQHTHIAYASGISEGRAEHLVKLLLPVHPLMIAIQSNSPQYNIIRDKLGRRRNTSLNYRSRRVARSGWCRLRTSLGFDHYDEYSYNGGHHTLEIRNLDANVPQSISGILGIIKPIADRIDDLEGVPITKNDYTKLRRLAITKGIKAFNMGNWFYNYYLTLTEDIELNKYPKSVREIISLAILRQITPLDIYLKLKNDNLRAMYYDVLTDDCSEYLKILNKQPFRKSIKGIDELYKTIELPKYFSELQEIEVNRPDLSKRFHTKVAVEVKRGYYDSLRRVYQDRATRILNEIEKIRNCRSDDELNKIKLPFKNVYASILKPDLRKVLRAEAEIRNLLKLYKGKLIVVGRIFEFEAEGRGTAYIDTLKHSNRTMFDVKTRFEVANDINRLIKEIVPNSNENLREMNYATIIHSNPRYYIAYDIENNEIAGCINVRRATGRIEHLCVVPRYRRIGIAKKLVEECINCSQQRPYCHISKKNKVVKDLFYKLGFRPSKDVGNNSQLWLKQGNTPEHLIRERDGKVRMWNDVSDSVGWIEHMESRPEPTIDYNRYIRESIESRRRDRWVHIRNGLPREVEVEENEHSGQERIWREFIDRAIITRDSIEDLENDDDLLTDLLEETLPAETYTYFGMLENERGEGLIYPFSNVFPDSIEEYRQLGEAYNRGYTLISIYCNRHAERLVWEDNNTLRCPDCNNRVSGVGWVRFSRSVINDSSASADNIRFWNENRSNVLYNSATDMLVRNINVDLGYVHRNDIRNSDVAVIFRLVGTGRVINNYHVRDTRSQRDELIELNNHNWRLLSVNCRYCGSEISGGTIYGMNGEDNDNTLRCQECHIANPYINRNRLRELIGIFGWVDMEENNEETQEETPTQTPVYIYNDESTPEDFDEEEEEEDETEDEYDTIFDTQGRRYIWDNDEQTYVRIDGE